MSEFRHEYKYVIDSMEESVLLTLTKGIIPSDKNVGADGTYLIRSLYFDDVDNSLFYDNLAGIDNRIKYRIRYYNDDTSFIRLEKKSKVRGMTKKESCPLSVQDVEDIIAGNSISILGRSENDSKLLREFSMMALCPKTIVTYERIPFVYQTGNVRITFDRKITASSEVGKFLSGDYRQRPILNLGESVLEVKWDEVLPTFIKDMLNAGRLNWSSFSKYAGCRTYNI